MHNLSPKMKLILKNFRCYAEKEFDLGESGLVLFSGPSGSGKTSILLALNFVLYGTGTKVTSYGKTSCKVELFFQNLHIIRTKRPNRVVLVEDENEYEDDAAQTIIDEKFGKAFDITAYVQQNALRSFILMSPLEKLSFLEKFAFHGVDLAKIKSVCKNIIAKRNDEVIHTTSQLEMATDHLKTLEKPEKVEFPLPKKGEIAIKNEYTRLKNTQTLLKKEEKNLSELSALQTKFLVSREKIENNRKETEKLSKKLLVQKEKLEQLAPDHENLRACKETLKFLRSHREYENLKKKYKGDLEQLENMKKEERDRMEKEVVTLKKKLWKKHTEKDLKKNLGDISEALKIAEKRESLVNTREILKKKIGNLDLEKMEKRLAELREIVQSREVYVCPSCDADLSLFDGQLHIFDCDKKCDNDDFDEELKNLEEKLPNLRVNVDKYREITDEIDEMQSDDIEELREKFEELSVYNTDQKTIEEQLRDLENRLANNEYSSAVKFLENSVENLEKKINSCKVSAPAKIEYTEEELMEIISDEERIIDEHERLTEEIEKMEEELEERITEKKSFEKISDQSGKISESEENISKLREKLGKHEENISLIEKYLRYKSEYKRYREWEEKVEKLQEEEKEKRTMYSTALQFKEKILQAESLAIANVIDSINIHAQTFLELFFPTDPIIVRLLPFKEGKKATKEAKPQINLQVEYKNMDADISMLSGGELSRVILAYTLALAEISGSPLVMLDECTASLDQELTSVVIEGIRENFQNRMVLVIAHQVVSGIFDRVIKL